MKLIQILLSTAAAHPDPAPPVWVLACFQPILYLVMSAAPDGDLLGRARAMRSLSSGLLILTGFFAAASPASPFAEIERRVEG